MSSPDHELESNDVPDDDDRRGQFDPSKYMTTHGSVPREIDVANEEHPLKKALGQSDHREFKYDPRVTGSRFAFRYDDPSAAVREYLANAETACIRRARRELVDTGFDESEAFEMDVHDLLERVSEEVGYHPIIEVYHAHHESDLPDLTIADNGIGISVEEFQVLEHIGMSANHDDGAVLGAFGQGTMSGFLLVGEFGEFELVTRSRLDDASYRERVRIDGFNDMPGQRDAYGTTFTFPSFCNDAQGINMESVMAELTEGMRIPVLYAEYGTDNSEVANEDYPPTSLREGFEESEPMIVYEDDAVEAVASPKASTWGRSPKTYLVSMPIVRNDGHKGAKHNCVWHFDLRIKYEDGRVYQCKCEGADHEGLVPVEDGAYERLPEERRAKYIPRSEIDEELDILMPVPVDDRDRLKTGFQPFYAEVSSRLDEMMKETTATILQEVADNGIGVLSEFPPHERALFFKGYQRYGHRQSDITTTKAQEMLRNGLGVDVPDNACEKLVTMLKTIRRVPRNVINPQHKTNHSEVQVWEAITGAGADGDVYMGITINPKKAKVAWEAGDSNQVVAIKNVGQYSVYEDVFGWKKLKEINLRKLDEQFPDLDDDFVKSMTPAERSRSSSSSSSSSSSNGAGYDPEKRSFKVRVGTGSRGFTTITGKNAYDTLDAGKNISVGYRKNIDTLLVLRQTDGHSATSDSKYCKHGIARAVVPDYLADYLLGADNTYESIDDLRRAHEDVRVTTYNISPFVEANPDADTPRDELIINSLGDGVSSPPASAEYPLGGLGPRTLVLLVNDDAVEQLRERIETDEPGDNVLGSLLSTMCEDVASIDALFATDNFDRLVIESPETLARAYLAVENVVDSPDYETPMVVTTRTADSVYTLGTTTWDIRDGVIFLNHELPPELFPRDSTEWDLITGGANWELENYTSRGQCLVRTLRQLIDDSDDQESVFVSSHEADVGDGDTDV